MTGVWIVLGFIILYIIQLEYKLWKVHIACKELIEVIEVITEKPDRIITAPRWSGAPDFDDFDDASPMCAFGCGKKGDESISTMGDSTSSGTPVVERVCRNRKLFGNCGGTSSDPGLRSFLCAP